MTPFDPRLPIIAAEARVKTCHVYHLWMAMREMGQRFHTAAFAQFSGLEDHHITRMVEALNAHDANPDKRSPTTKRASRLPDDWEVPTDWIDWAVEQRRWEPAAAHEEADNFRDFWQAKSGQAATKLDWKKTWQVWVRNSRRPDGDYRPSVNMVSSREHMEQTARVYEKMGRDTEAAEIRRKLAGLDNVVPFKKTVENEEVSSGLSLFVHGERR